MITYELSHWEWDTFFKDIDVLIIGSGIVGLSAAISIKENAPKRHVVVVDRGPLPIGASTRNAGFACFGSLSELLDDLNHSPKDEILVLVEERFRGLQLLRQRYGDNTIGYQAHGGYELFRAEDAASFANCQDQMESFNNDLRNITGLPDTFRLVDDRLAATGMKGINHLLLNQAEGQLHTGQLMHTLLHKAQSLGIRCLGGITIKMLNESPNHIHAHTNYGWDIITQQVLVCTNGFAKHLLPQLDVQPARNHVLITKPIDQLPIKGCFHYNRGYVYFRNVGHRLLLGGGRHLAPETETTDHLGDNDQIRHYLTQLLKEIILPNHNIQIDRWWSGIMGVGHNKRPIIQSLSDRLSVAVRLGGMGVALGTHAGEKAAQLITEVI